MDLVADAIAGSGEPDAVLLCDSLQIAVVVGVFKAGLQGVVIDIGHTALRFDTGNPHRLEFQIGHRAGCVLRQRLVDFQRYFAARRHIAADQMGFDDFLCDCFTHNASPFSAYFLWHVQCVP